MDCGGRRARGVIDGLKGPGSCEGDLHGTRSLSGVEAGCPRIEPSASETASARTGEEASMSFYIATKFKGSFAAALERAEAALKDEGFGIITRIDMEATLKSKIGAEFRPYVILGACNPELAFEALKLEDKVGTMLPCNLIVQEHSDGQVEIAAVDPVASMQAISNPRLSAAAAVVREKLRGVIDSLADNR